MNDRPILFSAPMIQALMAGRKTQTRRILKPQPKPFPVDGAECEVAIEHIEGDPLPRIRLGRVITMQEVRFAKGDRLWVRETWAKPYAGDDGYIFRADGPEHNRPAAAKHQWGAGAPWKSSIHMPRVASRLTLTVTDVRVERLQEISEEDAIAEGSREPSLVPIIGACWSERDAYAKLWEHINGPGSWGANPWVVALTFTVEQRNIDA